MGGGGVETELIDVSINPCTPQRLATDYLLPRDGDLYALTNHMLD